MTKDHTRDYATAAFRYWAQVGGLDGFKQKLQDEVESRAATRFELIKSYDVANPTENWLIAQEETYRKYRAEVADLKAVEEVLRITHCVLWGAGVRKAIEYVYFSEPDEPLEKGDIETRVHKAELMIPASYRSVYRMLRKAREMFVEIRELRAG